MSTIQKTKELTKSPSMETGKATIQTGNYSGLAVYVAQRIA